jgi:hypothetical protein
VKLFISYRRDDSAGYAGRLFDYLSAHFGAENVFMDIETIEPGEDFRQVVSTAMGTCDVVLVMIGKQWLNILDGSGRRRLDDPRDLVRMEVGEALANRSIRVIPVLVRDASMPGDHELPEELKELAWRNAIELSDSRFQHDARKLIGVIERIVVKTPTPTTQPRPASRKDTHTNRNLLLIGGGGAVLTVLALLVWVFRSGFLGATSVPSITPDATAAVLPSMTNPPPASTATVTVAPPASVTASPEPSPTATATQQDVPGLLVQLVDDYFMCINNARQDVRADYEPCWNMLSDRPGEFQEYLIQNSGGKESFIDSWVRFKVSYALYYCAGNGQQFVHARYFYYQRHDLSQPYTEMNLIDYRFALDDEGWRITSAFIPTATSSYCESQPRIDRLSIFQ